MRPPSHCAHELDRNQTAIIVERTAATDSLVTMESPTGERHISPVV
jgi:hypothetical protein